MTKAGNTVESMKPKEVVATVFIPSDAPQDPLNSPDIDECAPLINAGPDLEKWKVVSDGKTGVPYNPPAAIGWHEGTNVPNLPTSLVGGEFTSEQPVSQPRYEDEDGNTWDYNPKTAQWDIPVAAQITEEIPPTNLWSLRWRINQLEERVDELFDRVASHNVRSSWKI